MYQMEEMPNEELDDNEYMTKNLIETVTLLCRNNLKYNFELKIQGLLAITTDNQNVIVVQINEALPKKGSSVTGHHMGAGNNMMDCNLPPPQTRGLGGNVPNVSGMARGIPRATLGRGRLVRRGTLGNSQRMKAPTVVQNQMAARARIRQQLQFTTPQKRPPPSMMRSPGSAPIRAPRPQPSPHHQVEDSTGVMVPYEAPPARRTPVRRPQTVRPKVELVEGDEAYSTPKRPIKREASNCQQSSEVCVLSDEEEFNPPTLKAEIDQSPSRKRHMPVLSCEVDGEGSAIIQDSPGEVSGTEKAVGSQRIQVKSESVPSVEVETMEELEWSTSGQWQESSSQQHCCNQCGSVFHNMRGLRQHMRAAHPGGTSDNAKVLTVGSVISSPASSTSVMHSGTNQRCDDDLGEVI